MSVTISGSGQIIKQVVQVVKTDVFSTTSTTYTPVTGLSVSITPTNASNKILVFGCLSGASQDNASAVFTRNGTNIAVGDALGSRVQGTLADYYYNASTPSQRDWSKMFLDSPATTSAVTYAISVRTASTTFYINTGYNDGDTVYTTRTPSMIIVMEVAYA